MVPRIAIVVPCYNEQEVLPETLRRLEERLEILAARGKVNRDSRIYFVDDGSTDGTWPLIRKFIASGAPVTGIKLSRNRGHQNALLAGLMSAEGDAAISIDADLQDDVNAIDAMVDRFAQGFDVVYGVRRSRGNDSVFKRLSAQGFYRLLARCGVETIHNHADFRLLSRRAIEALGKFQEVNLYLRGMIPLVGLPSTCVEYDRGERFAGSSKYPLGKMLALAVTAITSFSIAPLRVISVLGLLLSLGSFALAVWVLAVRLFTDQALPGWSSTALPIYFLGGLQLLSLGVIGEYVGKIYLETKRRPRYVIEAVVSGGGTPDPGTKEFARAATLQS
jgi:glycosyltransferase involved in cell wall biosynthesis